MVARLEQKEFLNGAKHLKKLSSDARTGQDSSGEEDSDDEEPNNSTIEVALAHGSTFLIVTVFYDATC